MAFRSQEKISRQGFARLCWQILEPPGPSTIVRLIGNTNGITSVQFLKSVTISAKVPAPLKRKLERYRIVGSEVVRTALEREVMKAEHNDLARRLDEIAAKLSTKLKPDDVVAAVRSSRRER